MTQSELTFTRLPFSGAVDADGHVLEPPDIWERYVESKYQSRALRVRKDQHGYEYLEIDGRPSKIIRAGMLAGLGGEGRGAEAWRAPPARPSVRAGPCGSLDPEAGP